MYNKQVCNTSSYYFRHFLRRRVCYNIQGNPFHSLNNKNVLSFWAVHCDIMNMSWEPTKRTLFTLTSGWHRPDCLYERMKEIA